MHIEIENMALLSGQSRRLMRSKISTKDGGFWVQFFWSILWDIPNDIFACLKIYEVLDVSQESLCVRGSACRYSLLGELGDDHPKAPPSVRRSR